jgi:hypothetical protein
VVGECGIGRADSRWGWTPTAYAAVIDAVSRAEDLAIRAFVGASFAGQRLLYLSSTSIDWAVLVNPAPLAIDAGLFLRERRDAAYLRLAGSCADCEPGEVTDRVTAVAATLDDAPLTVPSRSLPVTGMDVGAAVMALGYQPEDIAASAWNAIETLTRVDLIGNLADTTWSRFGVEDVSPSWLAYLTEVCAAYADWPAGRPAAERDPVSNFLDAYHRPCSAVVRSHRPRSPSVGRLCVVSSADDGVAPSAFAATWAGPPNTKIIEASGSAHGDFAHVAECLPVVGVG